MALTVLLVMLALVVLGACTTAPAAEEEAAGEEFVFGVVLVGPKNDHGWSQAQFEGGQYIEQNLPGSRMIVFESLNPADKPEATLEGVVDEMVSQGAKLVFTTSDEFEEDTAAVAEKYPDVTFISVSGDDAWAEGRDVGKSPSNVGNIMGRMEDMKAIAGCAAALATESGKIQYVGPLINYETRRLVGSTYMGARHCWEEYRGNDAADLQFTVTWIGFWFNIPGVTLDPTEVVNQALDSGADVIMSGIDTTEAIDVTGQRAEEGAMVWAVPYDYRDACSQAPDICLGVPFFNWGPSYLATAKAVQDGSWEAGFSWNGADWADMTNPDTSNVGWISGSAIEGNEEWKANLDDFISKLASGDIHVWDGPVNLQDGTPLVAEGETATDLQVWYLEQLPEGVTGPSE